MAEEPLWFIQWSLSTSSSVDSVHTETKKDRQFCSVKMSHPLLSDNPLLFLLSAISAKIFSVFCSCGFYFFPQMFITISRGFPFTDSEIRISSGSTQYLVVMQCGHQNLQLTD